MEYKLPVFEAEDTCEEFNQKKSEFETDTYSKDKTYNLSSNITITRKLFTNKIQKLVFLLFSVIFLCIPVFIQYLFKIKH